MIKKLTMVLLAVGIFASLGFIVTNPLNQDEKSQEKTAYLGVYLNEVSEKVAKKNELAEASGAYIFSVMSGSAADDAGLKRGDIVTAVNGTVINSPEDLTDLIKSHKPGDVITLKLIRKGREQTLTVELGKKSSNIYSIYAGKGPHVVLRNHIKTAPKVIIGKSGKSGNYVKTFFSSRYYLGINYQNMNKQLGEYFGITDGNGVLIIEVEEDSPAEKAGLKAGDVIFKLAGKHIDDSRDLLKVLAIDSEEETESAEIIVLRNKKEITLNVELERKGKAIHIAPQLYMESLKDLEEHLENFEFHIDEGDFPIIVDEFAEGFNVLIDNELKGFGYRMKYGPDGEVEFNDKHFDSIKEFKEYLKSDEFKKWKEENKKNWNEKHRETNPTAISVNEKTVA